ncbi:hypothetical protein V2I01_27585 [Micromonospora sp. BRA006-A]|nr:hypothetical protein [Micromonospora sp. BRA006-A]
MTSLYWSSAALAGFAVPEGYFLGPVSKTDNTGRWGVEPQPTAKLLTAVSRGPAGHRCRPGRRRAGPRRRAALEGRRGGAAGSGPPPRRPEGGARRALRSGPAGGGRLAVGRPPAHPVSVTATGSR